MLNPKTFFPYLFSLVSLLIALGIANQGTGVEATSMPLTTPTATGIPQPGPFPGATWSVRCQALSQPRFFFYIPSVIDEAEPYLTITGTIYTSDLTPLSDAVVEIWRTDPELMKDPYPSPSRLYLRTDEAGHYQFTAMKPTRPEQTYLHYQIAYRDYCPLSLHLHLVTEASAQPAPQQSVFAKVVEVTGPVLKGPLDIVLPVPASGR